ncbi:DUF2283 domain-containing protein [Desulfurobacterium thermolithotrophum]|uniref:DUF2283 domain-containing protein n=1 Tax=Desulfurobacterium thermolithotrophum TaxID=64160 RepID=UPI0013D20990|nr:DUF2283 domain-containing protein [Desulfurobacterium thermolithotrophum]
MKMEYDSEVDALYIDILEKEIAIDSEEIAPSVIIDYGRNNEVVGIEILNASKTIKNLDALLPLVEKSFQKTMSGE